MAILGFDGTLWTREQFSDELARTILPNWIQFVVIHCTAAPNLAQARATTKSSDPDVDFSQRMKNFTARVREMGGRGWHVTVFENGKIGKGTPMTMKGIHANSWNSKSLGCEMCMDGDSSDAESHGGKIILDTAAWWAAQILKKLNKPANNDTVRFHNEEPSAKRRGKTCPGKRVDKDEFIKRVRHYLGQVASTKSTEVTQESKVEERREMWVNTPGDTLNFRAEPNGRIKSVVPHGLKIWVMGVTGDGKWSHISTPAGYQGWVYSSYLAGADPNEVRHAPEPSDPPVGELKFRPGDYRLSDFCLDWCKRFEGLRLKAYWDHNGWAIGYGHNGASGVPPDVYEDSVITAAEAERILRSDAELQIKYLNRLVTVPLTQGQVDACVLHMFQQGPGNFKRKGLLDLLNKGEFEKAADFIENWPTDNKGLLRRRGIEAQIFRGEKPTKW